MTADGNRSPSRILLTGARGFAGRHLLARLKKDMPDADILPLGRSHDLSDHDSLDIGDAAAVHRLIARYQPTVIVHLAALSSVGDSLKDPAAVWHVNFDGTRNLALAAKALDAPVRFIFASSGEVYGESFNHGPCDETMPLAPRTPYARSKAAAEYFLHDMADEKLEVISLRLFNHTGPGQDERFVVPAFAAQVVNIETGRQPNPIRVGNLDAQRDFTGIEDILDAYLAVLADEADTPGFTAYNVGSGQTRSIQSILQKLMALAHVPVSHEPDPARLRPSEIPVAAGSFSRFQTRYGWKAHRNFDSTLESVLDYFRSEAGRENASPRPGN